MTSVLVIGATGNIGQHLADALVRHKGQFSTIGALTSQSSLDDAEKKKTYDALADKGFNIEVAQIDNKDSLVPVFKKYNVVVSAVGAPGIPGQTVFIDAAVEAGVSRFYPSEFGSDTSQLQNEPVYAGKVKIQQYLKEAAQKNPQFSYTLFANGAFMEWFFTLPPSVYEIDTKNHTANVIGDLDAKISTTSFHDVGEYLVASLLDPSVGRNGSVRVQGQVTTWRNIIEAAEKAQGAKYEIRTTSLEAALEAEEQYKKNNDRGTAARMNIRRLFGNGSGFHETSHDFNLKTQTIDEIAVKSLRE